MKRRETATRVSKVNPAHEPATVPEGRRAIGRREKVTVRTYALPMSSLGRPAVERRPGKRTGRTP